ncbi:alcohol dehydrogenase [Citromicrobium sp. JL31]|uniref:alcohol dehydrogenase family protein n=2 Tax=Alphaproteobacteria TaxID=28211 RepID=UPI0006C91D53|nr:alcohol dehydrogenase [Citromicrobium sp. JL31]KPM18628.1 alcohol dehydrogenase [Citromicrobium sp. JL1351]KPM29618.1 alcohol dehydrogenase [Citromicrobium sp. JL2201]
MQAQVMNAVLLIGHGGVEKLQFRTDVPIPEPKPDEVLIRVTAAGVNNTDINTRLGWYSKSVTGATHADSVTTSNEDAGWSDTPITFPRIQGADVCGHIVEVGTDVDTARIGQRVLIRNMLRSYVDCRSFECWTLGSECDGGFADYVVAPAREVYVVECDWSDAALAAVPCAYSTAENMLTRAGAGAERLLITGASGGVGSAAIQLAKRRGAHVTALASNDKTAAVQSLGADVVLDRRDHPTDKIGQGQIDVVVDLVGGGAVQSLLETLKRGGRYAIAGAIAGPLAEIDLRTIYLKDISVLGCTFQEDGVFANLIRYIERGEIDAPEPKLYPLKKIAQAQQDFMRKAHTGKIVLVP